MKKLTYIQALEINEQRPLAVDEFNQVFKPIDSKAGDPIFDTYEEAIEKAKELNSDFPFNHLWTAVDGEEGECVLNGNRRVNRFAWLVTKKPWGNLREDDSEIYIEAEY